jgi:hypothetical protein
VGDALSRRYALLGWLVWKLARRRLRRKLRDGAPARGTLLRGVGAVAVLAALAAVWSRRGRDGAGEAP